MSIHNIVTSDTTVNVLEGVTQSIMDNLDWKSLIKVTERPSTDQFKDIVEIEPQNTFFSRAMADDLFRITTDDSAIFPWIERFRIITDYPRIPRMDESSIIPLDDEDITRSLHGYLRLWLKEADKEVSELIVSDFASELVLEGADAERVEEALSNPQPNPQRRKFLQEAREIFLSNENQSGP